MRSDEAILDEIIKDGSVDISEWPELLKRFLTRLEHIAHNSFSAPPPAPNTSALPVTTIPPTDLSTQSTAPGDPTPSETPAETSAQPSSNNNLTHIPDAFATSSPSMPPPPAIASVEPLAGGSTGTIAPEDLETLTQLTTILTTNFDTAPPYTIQRLAELLRNPTTHYRSLTKYLRALTRVLSVSSPSTVFPLEDAAATAAPNGAAFMLGSDESLGGALLSPIPWLTPTALSEDTMTQDGAGVTQGELMRTEQELGIVPAVEPEVAAPPPLGPEDVGPQPDGMVFADPPGVEEMGRVEKMRDASVEREEREREESLEDKMQLDAAADGKEEEEARKEREKEKSEENEEAKDENMAEA